MSEQFNFLPRTDMADEAHRLWQGKAEKSSSMPGVIARDSSINGFRFSEIEILDDEGSCAIGKAKGKYYSLLLPDSAVHSSPEFDKAVFAISELITKLCDNNKNNILVAALGNPDITPDALGHLAAQNILITRHLDRSDFPFFSSIALCRPGVLGTSGIESAQQVKCLCGLVNADLLIVIDALAGSEAERLCRCIQISDAGISPGSGVGNDRAELSRASIGIPVISIGMPTVIDAGYLGGSQFGSMFVTPRNIDSLVRSGAKLIGYGINAAVHKGLDIEDMDMLLN